MLACFRAGLALRAISEKLNIPFFTVQDWHQRYLKGDRHWAAEDDRNLVLRQTALALFQKGYGYKRASQELNVNVHTMRDWFRMFRRGHPENVFTIRTTVAYDLALRERIVAKRNREGTPYAKLSEEFGIPASTIRKWVKRAEEKARWEKGLSTN